jgi:iron complex transport system permease protein
MTETADPAFIDDLPLLANAGRRAWRFHALALLALLALLLASLSLGEFTLAPSALWAAFTDGQSAQLTREIVINFRLPGAITALCAGLALGVSGLLMQTLFQNPLAGPFVLGTDAGASLGVALMLLAGSRWDLAAHLPPFLLPLGTAAAAILGAGAVMLIIGVVAMRLEHPATLVVVGLMLSLLVGSLVSVLVYFSSPEQLYGFVMWGLGSFNGMTWTRLAVFVPLVLVSFALAMLLPKALNALNLGPLYAASLGVNTRQVSWSVILVSSCLAGATTAFCGPIGVLGTAIPHVARGLLRSADHRLLLPACATVGAAIALLAEILARTPGQGTGLPLNAVTALVAAPVVLWVLFHNLRFEAGQ